MTNRALTTPSLQRPLPSRHRHIPELTCGFNNSIDYTGGPDPFTERESVLFQKLCICVCCALINTSYLLAYLLTYLLKYLIGGCRNSKRQRTNETVATSRSTAALTLLTERCNFIIVLETYT